MKYVISGPPCSGKSTLIASLSAAGYPVGAEAARAIIERELSRELADSRYVGTVPWHPQYFGAFQEAVTLRQLYMELAYDGVTWFYDRSLVDQIAYCKLQGCAEPVGLRDMIRRARYERTMFMLDPVKYQGDASRREDPSKAELLATALIDAYLECGFNVVHVPAVSVEERRKMLEAHTLLDVHVRLRN